MAAPYNCRCYFGRTCPIVASRTLYQIKFRCSVLHNSSATSHQIREGTFLNARRAQQPARKNHLKCKSCEHHWTGPGNPASKAIRTIGPEVMSVGYQLLPPGGTQGRRRCSLIEIRQKLPRLSYTQTSVRTGTGRVTVPVSVQSRGEHSRVVPGRPPLRCPGVAVESGRFAFSCGALAKSRRWRAPGNFDMKACA